MRFALTEIHAPKGRSTPGPSDIRLYPKNNPLDGTRLGPALFEESCQMW